MKRTIAKATQNRYAVGKALTVWATSTATIYAALLFFPFGQTAPVGGLDIPGWLTGAGGVSALLTGLLWAVLIKDPPLLVPWRIHKEALDTIEKLNKQLDRYNRVAEKATDLRHPQQTQPQGAHTQPIPQPSSYRVSARKRGEQE